MISIVIPAHNEAGVIARTLSAITDGLLSGEADIVVVCNGCSDDTAEIARRWGSPIRVVETTTANKASALNLGDRAAGSVFPRFYIDADIVVGLNTICALADRLSKGDVLAVAPIGRVETSQCSWPVRWFFEVASLLPSAYEGIGGSGVYALSCDGRSRFDDFPNVIAEDAYVRIQFRPHECETIPGLTSTVYAPQRMKDLIQVKTRVRLGHLEVARMLPEAWRTRRTSNNRAILALFCHIYLWPKLLLYGYVTFLARAKARYRLRTNVRVWERDSTSRASTARRHTN
jgi:glycosyltransferase involved in cell wall biosynthesis